jgi:hypothetical protein
MEPSTLQRNAAAIQAIESLFAEEWPPIQAFVQSSVAAGVTEDEGVRKLVQRFSGRTTKARRAFAIGTFLMQVEALQRLEARLGPAEFQHVLDGFLQRWHVRLIERPPRARINGGKTTKKLGDPTRKAANLCVAAVLRKEPAIQRRRLTTAVLEEWERRYRRNPSFGCPPVRRHLADVLTSLGHR